MANHDEAASRRRDFLKAASGAAMALAAASDAHGQSTSAKGQTADAQGASAGREWRDQPDQPPDRGLWITWYDLPDHGRDEYFSWLHGTYLPALLKRPGYLWAAHYAAQDVEGAGSSRFHHVDDPTVGTGYHYILVIGARDAHVFGNPVPSEIHAALPEEGKKMLALRVGERVNIMTEDGRCEGRAGSAYREGLTGTPCIQLGSFNCPVEYEEEMLGGYVQLRLPAMCASGSCVRVRRLSSVAGWAKHGILYEFTSLEGFNRDYEPALAKSPLGLGGHSVVPMLIHAPNGPNSALRIWPPVPKA
jgi:hypothetical protein